MSVQAIGWAFAQKIQPASRKFVLVCLANFCGSEDGICFPSTETLSNCTSLDRKTVISSLDDLEKDGWIKDTGKRRGSTNQVKVYQLKGSQNRNYTVSGTVPVSENKAPVFPLKAPVFPIKGSQKRDTEPSGNRTENQTQEPAKSKKEDSIPTLRSHLNILFKRNGDARWGCEEEQLLVDLSSRSDWLSELEEIEGFFARGTYRPQKLLSLLRDWTGALDRARNWEENSKRNDGDKPKPKMSLADKELLDECRRGRIHAND